MLSTYYTVYINILYIKGKENKVIQIHTAYMNLHKQQKVKVEVKGALTHLLLILMLIEHTYPYRYGETLESILHLMSTLAN